MDSGDLGDLGDLGDPLTAWREKLGLLLCFWGGLGVGSSNIKHHHL